MIEKIKNKMEAHVNALLAKPIITNDEFMLLKVYLERLEFIASQEKLSAEREEHDKKFHALMSALTGGGLSGV